MGPGLAIVVSGVLFGLAHAESLQLLGLAVFGVILGVGLLPDRPPRHEHGGPRLVQRLALTAVVFPAVLGLRGLA